MKKLFLSLFLSVSWGCRAQFFSVKQSGYIFQVNVTDNYEAHPIDAEKEPATAQAPLTAGSRNSSSDSVRNALLLCYNSVALPLSDLSISSRFGWRRDPFDHSKTARHNGLDLKAATGSDVHAMFAGKVIRVSSDGRSGKFVSIQHGVYIISFCHLSKQLVKVGDMVQAGDVVGLSGGTGRSTGAHLHITVRRKGKYVNPVILLEYIIDVRTHALEGLNSLAS